MIVGTPVNSKGASLMGSLGSLLSRCEHESTFSTAPLDDRQ